MLRIVRQRGNGRGRVQRLKGGEFSFHAGQRCDCLRNARLHVRGLRGNACLFIAKLAECLLLLNQSWHDLVQLMLQRKRSLGTRTRIGGLVHRLLGSKCLRDARLSGRKCLRICVGLRFTELSAREIKLIGGRTYQFVCLKEQSRRLVGQGQYLILGQ